MLYVAISIIASAVILGASGITGVWMHHTVVRQAIRSHKVYSAAFVRRFSWLETRLERIESSVGYHSALLDKIDLET